MIGISAINQNVVLSDFKVCGWKQNGELLWMDETFPKDTEEIQDISINTIMAAKTRVATDWTSLMHSAKVKNVKSIVKFIVIRDFVFKIQSLTE